MDVAFNSENLLERNIVYCFQPSFLSSLFSIIFASGHYVAYVRDGVNTVKMFNDNRLGHKDLKTTLQDRNMQKGKKRHSVLENIAEVCKYSRQINCTCNYKHE